MNRRQKKSSRDTIGSRSQTVHIEFRDDKAEAVFIAGTFNDWKPEATRMVPLGAGRWAKDLSLPPGTYEYLFVVDGNWICDSNSECVPNPFGGRNAVLKVPA